MVDWPLCFFLAGAPPSTGSLANMLAIPPVFMTYALQWRTKKLAESSMHANQHHLSQELRSLSLGGQLTSSLKGNYIVV